MPTGYLQAVQLSTYAALCFRSKRIWLRGAGTMPGEN